MLVLHDQCLSRGRDNFTVLVLPHTGQFQDKKISQSILHDPIRADFARLGSHSFNFPILG